MIKRILSWLTNIAFLLVFLNPSISISSQERRIALVIGNGAYKSSPLRNPVNDAKDIAKTLSNLGFSVSLQTDANLRTMKRSIKSFGRDLREGGVGLFYYAGHGMQVNGRNYLVPIGADVNTESEVEYEAVDAGRVLGQMEDAGNGLNIVILDACRDNPFARSFRSSAKGLAKMDAPTGSFLAYATAPGSVAADGTGRNGLYTEKLLKHMKTPGLGLEKLFKFVRIEVANASGKTQVPWESSSLMGDFYFNPKRGIVVTGHPSTDSQTPTVETPKYAAISPKVLRPKFIEQNGHFKKYESGVVYDERTGLEWFAGPDRDTAWNEAKYWAENLSVGGNGWRMPTKNEVKTLFQKDSGTRNITPLLKTTGWYVWSVETKDSSTHWAVALDKGYGRWHEDPVKPYLRRGFAVRSRGKESVDKTPQYASISPKMTETEIIERDGNLVKFATGVVYDKNTKLEWYAGPDKYRSWYDAKKWVESLKVSGGGWRMPTKGELKTLYQKGAGTRNMTPLLKTTGWYVWAEERDSSSAWGFFFEYGTEIWNGRNLSNALTRGFAVRSRK